MASQVGEESAATAGRARPVVAQRSYRIAGAIRCLDQCLQLDRLDLGVGR
jgi:hypothetical protein